MKTQEQIEKRIKEIEEKIKWLEEYLSFLFNDNDVTKNRVELNLKGFKTELNTLNWVIGDDNLPF